jgi:serine/threonine-protein kinase
MSEHPITLGKYEVLSVLGRGGMGIVYQARDPIIGRVVAVKTISTAHDLAEDELRQRLQMEARSAGRLQHPNVATVYDFGTHEGTAYIVLEYVEGIDLAKVIDEKIEMSLLQKIDILIQIASGLSYAHELGVVHRDMKPSNVRLNPKGVPKIIDFGLARFDSTRLTKTGFMSGTIAYMSPERFQGDAGPSDDIFALGVIGFELLTYRRAFAGATPPEVMMKIMSQSLPAPSSVASLPSAIDPILLKATARDANDRYASAAEYADALENFTHSPECREFLAQMGTPAPAAPRRQRTAAFASLSGQRTVQIGAGDGALTAIVDQNGLSTASTESTSVNTMPAAPADQTMVSVEPDLRKGPAWRRWSWAFVLAAVALIGTFIALGTRSEPGNPARASRTSATESKSTAPAAPAQAVLPDPDEPSAPSPLATEVDVQRTIFASLRKDLGSFDLDRDEKARLDAVDVTARLAEERFGQRNFAESARLLSTGIEALRGLQRDHYNRFRRAAATPAPSPATPEKIRPAPRRSSPSSTVAEVPPPEVPPQSEPPVERRPPVTETAVPVPSPVSQQPTREEVARRAAAFISRVAKAYEARDVSFFRDHDANFTERTANAVRSSPSAHVEMKIQAIDHSSDGRTRVTVVRTDTFEKANIPPGVQTLVYTLQPAGDSWRIVSIDRR